MNMCKKRNKKFIEYKRELFLFKIFLDEVLIYRNKMKNFRHCSAGSQSFLILQINVIFGRSFVLS